MLTTVVVLGCITGEADVITKGDMRWESFGDTLNDNSLIGLV